METSLKGLDMLKLLLLDHVVQYYIRGCGLLLLFTDSVAWSLSLSHY